MINEIKIKASKIDGVMEITAEGWDGKIIRMSHRDYETWRLKGDKPITPIVYILYADHFDRERHGNELYIGHTSNAQIRVDDHVAKKTYWSMVAMFTSTNDWMNVAFTKNIEYTFIEWAKTANRYKVMNGNDSAATHLGVEDRAKLDKFLAGVKPILKLAGIDIFETNLDGAFIFNNKYTKPLSKAVIRIEELGPTYKIKIEAGSVLSYYDDTIVQAEELPGVIYSPAHSTHIFTQEVSVEINMTPGFARLFGKPLPDFKNICGTELRKVLREAANPQLTTPT